MIEVIRREQPGRWSPDANLLKGGGLGKNPPASRSVQRRPAWEKLSLADIHFGFLQTWAQLNNWAYWRQPWLLEDARLVAFREYGQLRYRLLPYIYSTAAEAALTGYPVMRAMSMVYPDDPACSKYLGFALYHAGRLEEAIRALEPVARRGLETGYGRRVRLMLALAHYRCGDEKTARAWYAEVVPDMVTGTVPDDVRQLYAEARSLLEKD